MEAVLNNKKVKINNSFDFEMIDYSKTKNNGFEVESIDFCDLDKHIGVIPIEEMDSKEEMYTQKKKFEYIELDEKPIIEPKKSNSHINDLASTKKNLEKTRSNVKAAKLNLNPVIDTIEFNSLKGSYAISYHELGQTKIEEYYLGKKDLYENELKIQEKIAKWGSKSKKLNRVDMNLYSVLSRFDIKHNSSCAKEYLNGNSDYITNYHMSKIFKNKEYSLKEKLSLIRTANRQRKYRKAQTENPKGIYAMPALASFALILGLLGVNIPNNKNTRTTSNINTKDIVSEYDSEEEVTSSTIDKLVEESTTKEVTTEKVVVEDTKEDEKELKEETKEASIHDEFVLDNMDLEYSPIENIKHVNTNDLSYIDNYKMSLISAYDGNTILCNERVSNMDNISQSQLVENLTSEYGDNIKIYINWDGFDKDGNQILKNVGWTNVDNIDVTKTSENGKTYVKTLKK